MKDVRSDAKPHEDSKSWGTIRAAIVGALVDDLHLRNQKHKGLQATWKS